MSFLSSGASWLSEVGKTLIHRGFVRGQGDFDLSSTIVPVSIVNCAPSGALVPLLNTQTLFGILIQNPGAGDGDGIAINRSGRYIGRIILSTDGTLSNEIAWGLFANDGSFTEVMTSRCTARNSSPFDSGLFLFDVPGQGVLSFSQRLILGIKFIALTGEDLYLSVICQPLTNAEQICIQA